MLLRSTLSIMKIFHRRTQTIMSRLTLGFLIAACVLNMAPKPVAAIVQNPTPTAKVSFTFDDGLVTTLNQAAPTLAKYGLTGTDYVITGCVGMTTTPNTCHANTDNKYMSWAQVAKLQNTYGWEIGSHTNTHPYLASSDATDGQPNVLTPAQVRDEMVTSKAAFAAHGINATDFASPYGDYNNAVLAQIAKVYASHRGFADQANNVWSYNDYLLYDLQVQAGVTVAQVKAKIDTAIANNQWIVLTFHGIKAKASTNPDNYEYNTADLDKIAAYVKSKQDAGAIKAVNVSQGLVTSDTNMFANSTFNSGIAQGWTTDSPSTITADNGTNGSYPDATNSVKLGATTKESHLFSPRVATDPNTTYMFKSFLNLQTISSGEVGYYVDEYDANGNWISGQYKKAERSSFVESMNFTYKPTSQNVATSSLQVIVAANSGISAYVDNFQMFALSSVAAPVQTDLMTNGTFDAGLSGWRTDDPTRIVADNTSNGSPANPVNSVKFTATNTANSSHLFSPIVNVDNTKTYSLKSYLNLTTLTSGEVAYYIDEYDANGTWISGQYKLAYRAAGVQNPVIAYTPSSAAVKKSSLQLIITGNNGATGYFDDVRWYQN